MVCEFWPSVKGNIAEAHKQIVRVAMYKVEERVLICEDDVMFMADDGFDYFLSKYDESADVFLGGCYVGKEQLPNEGSVVKRFSGMHLYIVHSRFYKTFLSLDCSNESIDNALSRLALAGKAKIVCCYPFAAIQQEMFKSTNPIMKGVKHSHRQFNSTNTYGFK